jgi:hypothetical protein
MRLDLRAGQPLGLVGFSSAWVSRYCEDSATVEEKSWSSKHRTKRAADPPRY